MGFGTFAGFGGSKMEHLIPEPPSIKVEAATKVEAPPTKKKQSKKLRAPHKRKGNA